MHFFGGGGEGKQSLLWAMLKWRDQQNQEPFQPLELSRHFFAWPRGQSIEVLQCKDLPFNHYKSRTIDLFSLYGLNV